MSSTPPGETERDRTPVLLEATFAGVRLLTLNRPAKKNALSGALVRAIVAGVAAAADDDEVRVVGLTGAGDAFCAGADLSPRNRASGGSAGGPITDDDVVRLVRGIRVDCEKPVVAGINGVAVGAGVALAMCDDIRIASSTARFHPGYARAGSSPDGGLSWTLPQEVGHEHAMRFLLDPQMIDAQAALALGLVGEVVSADEFDEAFRGTCRRIAAVAPQAARQTKRLVTRAGLLADLDAHLRDEVDLARRALASDDGREAVRAIFEKRKPNFTGR